MSAGDGQTAHLGGPVHVEDRHTPGLLRGQADLGEERLGADPDAAGRDPQPSDCAQPLRPLRRDVSYLAVLSLRDRLY